MVGRPGNDTNRNVWHKKLFRALDLWFIRNGIYLLYPDAQIAEVMERVSNLNAPYAAFYTADEFVPWENVSMMIYVLWPFCKLLLGVCKQSPISRGVLEEAPPKKKKNFKGLPEIFI